jgi:restriction endonuclease S subunit
MAQISLIKKSDIENAERFDAEYFKPEYLRIENTIKRLKFSTIKNILGGNNVFSGPFGSTLKSSSYQKSGIPFIRISDIQDIFIQKNNLVYISENESHRLNSTSLNIDDIVLSKIGTIGRLSLITKELGRVNISENNLGLRLDNLSIKQKRFLLFFLLSKFGQSQIFRKGSGNVQLKFNVKDIDNLVIPDFSLFDLDYFKNIYDEIILKQQQAKELYTEAEQILLTELDLLDFKPKHKLSFSTTKSSIENASRFDAEYFQPKVLELRKLFESENSIKIKDVITTSLVSGSTPKSGGNGYEKDGKIKFIRAVNLGDLEIHYNDVLYIKDEIHNKALKRSKLQTNDVVFSIAGVIGRCAVVKDDIGQANINQALAIIRLNQKVCNPYYVALFFNSKYGNQYVNDISRPVAQTNLNLTELSNIYIPLLPMKSQQQIANKVTISHKLRQESKNLLEQAKLKVEQEIERVAENNS